MTTCLGNQGCILASTNPKGTVSTLLDPSGMGPMLPDPEGMGASLPNPEGMGLVLPDLSGVSSISLKALVWFWWIDETLSANLVYQVIMR